MKSELDELSDGQKVTLMEWTETLTYREILERIEKAPPEGLGVRTSLGSLSRFAQRWRYEELMRQQPQAAEEAETVLKATGNGERFEQAALAALRQRIFRRAVGSKRDDPETFRTLLLHEARLKKLALAERNLTLAQRRFEFNAAREALRLLPELNEIAHMDGPDDESKVWMAREKLFGVKEAKPSTGENRGVGGENQTQRPEETTDAHA